MTDIVKRLKQMQKALDNAYAEIDKLRAENIQLQAALGDDRANIEFIAKQQAEIERLQDALRLSKSDLLKTAEEVGWALGSYDTLPTP